MITNALPDIPRSYTAICEWAACVVYIAVLFRRVPPRRSVVVSMQRPSGRKQRSAET